MYAEEDEEDFSEFKALSLSNAKYDPQAAAALKGHHRFRRGGMPRSDA
jgi:hypothetical protein